MDKQKVTQFFKGIQKAASKKSPEILTGIGIAGMITTTVLAVKATPKALELIENEKESKKEDLMQDMIFDVAKNRDGYTGTINAIYDKEKQIFKEIENRY